MTLYYCVIYIRIYIYIYIWHNSISYVYVIYYCVIYTSNVIYCDIHKTHAIYYYRVIYYRDIYTYYHDIYTTDVIYDTHISHKSLVYHTCLTYICHTYMKKCLAHVWVRSCQSHMWHDSYMCEAFLHICETWRIHPCLMCVCDVTHSSVQHDSVIRVTWLIRVWDIPSYKCDMTHS